MIAFRSTHFAYLGLLATALLVSLSSTAHAKTAVVFGATGTIGNDILRSIVDEPYYTKVILVGRKEFPPKVTDLLPETLEVTTVIHPDLGTIDQHPELAAMDADACFVAAASGNPQFADLHDWHYIEVVIAESISKVCGKMKAQSISVFTAVEGDEAKHYSEEELAKTNEPIGWMKLFSDTIRMMRLKEEAVISASEGVIPYIRIFQPSNIITRELRYGWLDWSLFKFHAVFDEWLPTEYHSVTTELLADAMVEDSVQVLSGKTTKTGTAFLKYGDFLTILGEDRGEKKATEL